MDTLIIILVCLAASYILSEICKHIGLPKVLGPLIVGLLFGATPLNRFFLDNGASEIITLLKDLAVIFLLFFVGLKIDFKQFMKSSKLSLSVGSVASALSLVLGYAIVILLDYLGFLHGLIPENVSVHLVGFVVGLCLSVTAEAVSIEILEELKLLTTRIGETIIEAGIIDDVIGLFLISILVTFIESGGNPGAQVLKLFIEIALFIVIIYLLVRFLVPKIMKFAEHEKSRVDFFIVALIIALFLSVISLKLGLSSVLGALAGGVIVRHVLLRGDRIERREEKDITAIIEITTFGLLAPFFFIWIGANTDPSVIWIYPVLTIIIIGIAFIGKIFGSIIGAHLVGASRWEGHIIGWGMNIRGAVGFIVATIVLENGLITPGLFSVLVFMAFATTFISPIVFKLLVKKHHGIE